MRGDREDYLRRLAACRDRFHFFLYAYCLMDNHVHLALERGPVPLSRIMLVLQSTYSQGFNRRHDRVGHLFQGRYSAFLVQKERYLAALIRYIHDNPVKAGIVRSAEEYEWSSARHYRTDGCPGWLDRERFWSMLANGATPSSTPGARFEVASMDGYENVTPIERTIRGDVEYARRQLRRIRRRLRPAWTAEALVSRVAAAERLSLEDLKRRGHNRSASRARALAAYLGWQIARIPIAQTARVLDRGESTISRRVVLLESRLETDRALRGRVAAIAQSLREHDEKPRGRRAAGERAREQR
jgi:REP element-mobilizing transposase RayT